MSMAMTNYDLLVLAQGSVALRNLSLQVFYQDNIAKILLPQNYCVGFQGGCRILVYTTMLKINKCVIRMMVEMNTNLQMHYCITTYATNMLNCSNQEIFQANLDRELPGISSYYKAIYGDDMDVWYIAEDGSNHKFCQEDGHIQGRPLSSTLSAITIKHLVEDLQQLVTEHMINTVEAAHNDQTIPSFNFFSHNYRSMMPHCVSRSRRSSLFSGC